MTKQQVIDILEAYKPSGNIYNGYNSIEEKIDERICYLIDEIIERVKREPDNEWIKCSEKMPKSCESVLVVIENSGNYWIDTGYIDRDGYWMIDGKFWDKYWDRESDPAITHWMPLPNRRRRKINGYE